MNRWALKHIRQSAKKSQFRTSGKTLHILIGNLVLLRDHPESCDKIQDNYKSEDPNVFIIQSLDKKGPKITVNRWQLFHLKKSQVDPVTSDPSIKGPKFDPKLKKINMKPQISHPNGTRSKTKATPITLHSTDIQHEQSGHLGLGQWVRMFLAPSRVPLSDN